DRRAGAGSRRIGGNDVCAGAVPGGVKEYAALAAGLPELDRHEVRAGFDDALGDSQGGGTNLLEAVPPGQRNVDVDALRARGLDGVSQAELAEGVAGEDRDLERAGELPVGRIDVQDEVRGPLQMVDPGEPRVELDRGLVGQPPERARAVAHGVPNILLRPV